MMHVRKESWKDITQKAQEAVYSDMEITLDLNYRKLRCLRGGLLALEPGMEFATDEMRNIRATLLKEIEQSIAGIKAEAVRFKTLLDTEVQKNLVELKPEGWEPNENKRLDEDGGPKEVIYDLDSMPPLPTPATKR